MASEAAPRRVSLEEVTELLGAPPLAAAKDALEQGRVAAAAAHVKLAMTKTPPAADDVKRWQFLLARLLELAGDARGAAASYDLAASEPWALQPYARLGAGRALLRLERTADALSRLSAVPSDIAASTERGVLLVKAAAGAGERDLAITTARALLADDALADRVGVAIALGEALLARARATEPTPVADVEEAVGVARRASIEAIGSPALAARATAILRRAVVLLPKERRAEAERPTAEDSLLRVRVLLDARQDQGALDAAAALADSLPAGERWGSVGCELAVLVAKAHALRRERGKAADALTEPIARCKADVDQRARILFLGAKYAAQDGRHAVAVDRYGKLEQDAPAHRLADDARLAAAISYYEMGAEARFTELLATMPEEYPDGDVVLDGVFRLALRRIEKGDWSGAASVLDRAAVLVGPRDSARGTEFSGRERYFRARAWMETGEPARGLDELEALVRELPLSYYMLHAYSRLAELDPARAEKARGDAIEAAAHQPFAFEHRAEFDEPGFQRALELLRQGDVDRGKAEIAALGITKRGVAPGLLWGVALLYARAGSPKLSHEIARGLLTDWLARWPAGDWSRAWELAFPRPYHPLVERETRKNEVPEALVYGVMREESAFDPDALSPADAHGLMQIIPPTAKMYAVPMGLPWDTASLRRPAINVALGARILSKLTTRFEKNPVLAIPAYNAGPGRPVRWLRERPAVDFDVWVELIPFDETRRYTKRVLASRAAYAVLYDAQRAEQFLRLPLRLDP